MTATLLTTVIDSPEHVWEFWAQPDYTGTDFWTEWADELTPAAIAVLGRHLANEWAERGQMMITLPWRDFAPMIIMPPETVWDAAVAKLDFDDILTEAKLDDEYSAYCHAQPDYDL